jgi:GH15 family glucan-1,4-alpha-glucosidase
VGATFTLRDGARALLTMSAADDQPLPLPERASIERRLGETVQVWRSWIARHSYEGPWQAAVERSLLTIRLLSDARSGAITAAGTTSLPEVLGGKRNYDYRFGWVRDLSFTLDALLAVGLEELSQEAVSWLLRATEQTHPRIDPVYALNGQVVRSQSELPLAGYRGTRPVHVGNQAGAQLQLGGFGDLLETLELFTRQGHVLNPPEGERLADFVDLLSHIWRNEDSGLWELGDRAHYTTSKLGCWVAFDRTLELVRRGQVPPRHVARWEKACGDLRHFIETRLWSEEKRSYLFKAGSDGLDCGTLLLARRGFLDPEGERMRGTIDAIASELRAEGPLFYRYSGMQHQENAFLACSFWMVEAMAAAGRRDQAAELMDAATALGNDVGLFSEEIEPGTHALWGNLPQALTHLALINAAVAFSDR